jgi:hypothetical protein
MNGGYTIVPRSLRLRGIKFSLVGDEGGIEFSLVSD